MQDFIEKHRRGFQLFVWGSVVFMACFSFPLFNKQFLFTIWSIYLHIAYIGMIGEVFAFLYQNQPKNMGVVWRETLIFSIVGLICRYLLEFGEVSNTYNFTVKNIAVYLGCIPLLISLCFMVIKNSLQKNDK